MAGEGDAERLVVLLEARIRDFERNLQKASGTATRTYGQMRRDSASATRQMEADMARSTSRINQLLASTSASMGSFAKVAAAGFAAAGVREVGRYADAWTNAGNKIRAAGEMSGMQGRSLEKLNDIARRSRSGLEETVDLYARMLRSANGVAKSEEEVARATEVVSKAFKTGGATAQEAAAGVIQLGQALGSGFLQGDELRSIRENAGVLAQAIADHFGVAIGELKDLGAEGKITSEEVFKAILAGANKIEAAFAKTTPTIADGFVQMKNSALELVGALDRVSGASNGVRGALGGIVGEIDRITEAVKRYEAEGNLDSLLNIGGMSLVEGGPVDRLRDWLNGVSDSMKTTADDVAAERDRIGEHIKALKEQIADFKRSAQENQASPIIAKGFEDAAREAQADLERLQEELAEVERAAVAAGNNGAGALANLAQSAVNAMNAATEAAAAASKEPELPTVNGKASGVSAAETINGVTVHRVIRDFAKELGLATDASGNFVDQAGNLVDEFGNLIQVAGLTEDAYGNLFDACDNLVDAFGNVIMSAADLAANLKWNQDYDKFRDAQSDYNRENPFGPSAELIRDVSGRDVTGMISGRDRITGMDHFAEGGIAREASIFGEAGPEAAVPLPDGRTIPVTLSGGGMLSAIEGNTALTVDQIERLIGITDTMSGDILAMLRRSQASASASYGSRAATGSAATGGVGGGIWMEPEVKAINTGYGAYVPGHRPTGVAYGYSTGAIIPPSGAGSTDTRFMQIMTRPDEAIAIMTPDQRRSLVGAFEQLAGQGGDSIINMGGITINVLPGADQRQGSLSGQAAFNEFSRRVASSQSRYHGR